MPFFVSGLYKFMGKLADRIFVGVQCPRGLGVGCRSLCLAFISRSAEIHQACLNAFAIVAISLDEGYPKIGVPLEG